ncbi:MAG: hypothetical protein NW217_17305 [Hyphomicrobiaceae bacterium]|nr:hypothetical protein [Hyphomicrobiaceae bacterium]
MIRTSIFATFVAGLAVLGVLARVPGGQGGTQPAFADDRPLPGFDRSEAARLKAKEDERLRAEAVAAALRKSADAERRKAEENDRLRVAKEAVQRAAEVQRLAEEDARRLAAAEVQRRLAVEAQQRGDGERALVAGTLVANLQSPRQDTSPMVVGAISPARCSPVGSYTIATGPLPAGRVNVGIVSPCRAGQAVSLRYGGYAFTHALDRNGRLDLVLDLFQGTRQPASIVFADNSSAPLTLPAVSLAGITKIALVWKGAVDLDLHALEYVAARGGKGHVWAMAPSSAASIQAEPASAEKRGRGFLSSSTAGDHQGDNVEVYTFMHVAGQSPGTIRLEVDYKTRGDRPSGATCGQGQYAQLDFAVVRLLDGGEAKNERLQFSAAPCGVVLDRAQRHSSYAIGDLRIRN